MSDEDMRQAEQGLEIPKSLIPSRPIAYAHQLVWSYIIALIPCVVIAAFLHSLPNTADDAPGKPRSGLPSRCLSAC